MLQSVFCIFQRNDVASVACTIADNRHTTFVRTLLLHYRNTTNLNKVQFCYLRNRYIYQSLGGSIHIPIPILNLLLSKSVWISNAITTMIKSTIKLNLVYSSSTVSNWTIFHDFASLSS